MANTTRNLKTTIRMGATRFTLRAQGGDDDYSMDLNKVDDGNGRLRPAGWHDLTNLAKTLCQLHGIHETRQSIVPKIRQRTRHREVVVSKPQTPASAAAAAHLLGLTPAVM